MTPPPDRKTELSTGSVDNLSRLLSRRERSVFVQALDAVFRRQLPP